jgi:hypothetical protein
MPLDCTLYGRPCKTRKGNESRGSCLEPSTPTDRESNPSLLGSGSSVGIHRAFVEDAHCCRGRRRGGRRRDGLLADWPEAYPLCGRSRRGPGGVRDRTSGSPKRPRAPRARRPGSARYEPSGAWSGAGGSRAIASRVRSPGRGATWLPQAAIASAPSARGFAGALGVARDD